MRKFKWWLRQQGQKLAPRLTHEMLARRTWLHEPEVALLPLLADRASTAIDIGANKGVYLYHLHQAYGRVVAFEPLPELASFLTKAAPYAEVHGIALSDHAGRAELTLPVGFNELGSLEHHAGTSADPVMRLEQHDVPVRTLDSFEFKGVGLIKIDVEGHELSVLKGAQHLIDQSRPAILIEVEERHKSGSIAAVEHFFETFTYDGYFLDGDRLRPIRQFDADDDQNVAALTDSVKAGRYINNFIFFPRDRARERAIEINRWLQSQAWQEREKRSVGYLEPVLRFLRWPRGTETTS